MKKILMFSVICLLIIIGCTNNNSFYFNRYTEEIKNIKYNELALVKEDYQSVNDILENLKFDSREIKNLGLNYSIIDITTIENETHHFYIYPDNNIIKYTINNITYYATGDTSKIVKLYNDIKNKYNDTAFFNVEYTSNYDGKDENAIKLEETSEALIINTNQEIYNLKLYKLESIDCSYRVEELIYANDSVTTNNNIVFKISLDSTNQYLKLIFTTKYNYQIETTIEYNKDINNINLIKKAEPILK